MTFSAKASELRLAATAMRHAIEAARGAVEIAGLCFLEEDGRR